jgi:hydroxyethylthiazole kinase
VDIETGRIWNNLKRIRDTRPVVHNITNYVVMNNTANALLSLGASPVMAHAPEEVTDMVSIAAALVINIGTLSRDWVASMGLAMMTATRRGIPIVLDPVGAGATEYRTRTARELIRAVTPAIIRGNASEIMALTTQSIAKTKGVDSLALSHHALAGAKQLSLDLGAAICISGEVDYIVHCDRTIRVRNGHPLMPRVTGLGCTATALCGAFAAVEQDPVLATVCAMAVMGIAGEMAGEDCPGPGSFQVRFLDALYNLSEIDMGRISLEED